MPDDAGGNYSLPDGYLAVTGQKVQPSNHNPPLEDIEAALTNRYSRDGRAPLTGNMNANSFKIFGLADGVDPTDSVNKGQLDAVEAVASEAVKFTEQTLTDAQKKQARENIGATDFPIGYPVAFPGAPEYIDDGWDELSGQEVLRSNYPDLWALVEDGKRGALISESAWQSDPYSRLAWSTGDGSTTFRFPDYNGVQTGSIKGLYLRGYGRAGVGALQGDAIRNIVGSHSLGPVAGAVYGDALFSGSFEAGDSSTGLTSGPATQTSGASRRLVFDASASGVPTTDPVTGENRPVTGSIVWVARTRGATATPLTPSDAATLGANVFSGAQKMLSLEADTAVINGVLTGRSPDNNVNKVLRGDGTWGEVTKSFSSGNLNIASILTVSHGLGAVPNSVAAFLICVSEEWGYSVNDIVVIPSLAPHSSGASDTTGAMIFVTSTLVGLKVAPKGIYVIDKSSGQQRPASSANWQVIMRAHL